MTLFATVAGSERWGCSRSTSWCSLRRLSPHRAENPARLRSYETIQNVQTQPGGFMSKKMLLSLCAVALLAVSAFGQTADELLEKNLKAMGGKDKLMALKS